MPDLADLQNILAAKKQAKREAIAAADAAIEAKKAKKAEEFLLAQIAAEDAEIESLRSAGIEVVDDAPAPAVAPPPPPVSPPLTPPAPAGDSKE